MPATPDGFLMVFCAREMDCSSYDDRCLPESRVLDPRPGAAPASRNSDIFGGRPMEHRKLLIGGDWRPAESGRTEDVTSPYDGSVVGTVPVAGGDDVEAALTAAEAGAVIWRRTPAHERMRILLRAAEIARTISAEVGKTITEATGEAARSGEIIRLAAFEGAQLYGDTLPLDASPGTGLDKI